MGLFSRSPSKQSYIGVDIGASGIKLVELVNERGRSRLNTYAFANLPPQVSGGSILDHADFIAPLLKNMVQKARCLTTKAVSALPQPSVFSSIITVPTVPEKELAQAIQAQAKKLIPLPIEEVSLYYNVIEGADPTKKSTRVFMTGAPKSLVQKEDELFKKSGLQLLSLETEILAQIRSLIGKDRSTIMLIDIGAERTNISVVEKGIPFFTRSIATGGASITNTIAKTLGISQEQAETMKRDIRTLQQFAPSGDIAPMLQTLIKPILDEIRYSFSLYQSQGEAAAPGAPTKRIDKIILTGGSAVLPRLPEFLTQLMNVNTYLGDPWARVMYPPELRPVLDEIGSRFTVALGCAMRDIDAAS